MKRIVLFLLAAVLLLLPGCGMLKANANDLKTPAPAISETIQPTASPTLEPSTSSTLLPTPTPTPSPTPASTPSETPQPTPTPAPTPTVDPMIETAQGSFSGNTYTNDYFGMTMTKPKAWIFATPDELAKVQQSTASLTQPSQPKTYYCCVISEAQIGSASDSNLIIACTDLGATASTLSPVDLTKKTFGKATSVKINGVLYGRADGSYTLGGKTVTQVYYETIIKNYLIQVVLTSFDKGSAATLQKMMKTIKIK